VLSRLQWLNKYLQVDKKGKYFRKNHKKLDLLQNLQRMGGSILEPPATHFRVENENLAKSRVSDNSKKKLKEGIASRESPENGYLKLLSLNTPKIFAICEMQL